MALFLITTIIFLALWLIEKKKVKASKEDAASITREKESLEAKYASVIDADAEADRIRTEANAILDRSKADSEKTISDAKASASMIVSEAKDDAKRIRDNAQKTELKASESARIAKQNSDKIISDAQE